MWVKIGDKWHNSNEEPICIQISSGEQKQIGELDRNVAPEGKYAIIPDGLGWDDEQIREWMKR